MSVLLFVASSSTVRADIKEDCVAAVDAGQRLREVGQLRSAREQFLLCAAATCPAVLQRDCHVFLQEVEEELPTVIFRAFDSAGQDLVEAKVVMDGQPFRSALDGKATMIDPGRHVFRFEVPNRQPIEVQAVVAEHEKARVISVRFPEEKVPVPPPPPRRRAMPMTVVAFGSLGLVGLGTSIALGVSATSELDGLRSQCAPHCSTGDVDAVRHKALAADIALGVGLVGLAAATYSWFTWRNAPLVTQPTSGSMASPATQNRYGFDMRGVGGGAVATIEGTF